MTKAKHFEIVEGLGGGLKQRLFEEFRVDALDVEDVFTYTQLAKIERKEHYLYVALHFPQFDHVSRHFRSKEVHCFVTDTKLLVVDKDGFSALKDFEEVYHWKLDSWSSFDAFYELLDYIVTRMFRVIGKFREEIKAVESTLFDERDSSEAMLLEILIIKRNLINYLSIIGPLLKVLTDLETKYTSTLTKLGLEKIDDSRDKIEKIVNNLANFRDQITLLKETNETLIAQSTNQTVKKLTGINLLVFVPTLITSFFGMNVYFGALGQEASYEWVGRIVIFMFISTLLVYAYFRKRDWI